MQNAHDKPCILPDPDIFAVDNSEKSTTHVHNPADHPDAERDFHKKGKKLYDWSDYDWPEDNGESKEWDGLGDDPEAKKNEVQHGEIHHDWDGFGDDPYLDMLDEEPLLGGNCFSLDVLLRLWFLSCKICKSRSTLSCTTPVQKILSKVTPFFPRRPTSTRGTRTTMTKIFTTTTSRSEPVMRSKICGTTTTSNGKTNRKYQL